MARVPVPACSILPPVLVRVAACSVKCWLLAAMRPPVLFREPEVAMAVAPLPLCTIWPPFVLAMFEA